MPANSLTDEQRQTLWEQFVQVYGEEQKAYDSSVRALSAAGVAVTVSLATALRDMPATGTLAVVLFLVSLGINLASYVTSQLDMRARLACLRSGREEGIEGNDWTIATTILNGTAGLAFIAGGVSLAFFVGRST